MAGLLFFFHCGSNTGYAIGRHERTFARTASRLVGNPQDIHFAYPNLDRGRSDTLPDEIRNIIRFDASSADPSELRYIAEYIAGHRIRVAFGFDQPARQPAYATMRRAGVRRIIAYWGAPMSSLNSGIRRLLKRLDVALAIHRPDHFVFQSEGMRDFAVRGRGIPRRQTSVIRSGVDVGLFSPPACSDTYAHDVLKIDRERRLIFFSGHMEERKGVHVIVKAAAELVNQRSRKDVHFVLLGNYLGQERRFDPLYKGTEAEQHILFGGYRDDVPAILKSCYAGIIASTVWDSFPMSSLEMAASGLPIVVSDLTGLREAVDEGSGFRFPVGDHIAAADRIAELLDDEALRNRMGAAARRRAENGYTVEEQISGLERVVRQVAGERI